MNNVQLSGRLVKDPDVRWTNSGKQVCTFTVASQRPFKNANGEYDADFINCIAWDKTAEMIGNYFAKGDSIMIPAGRIQVRTYEGNDGNRRWATEVVVERVEFMESKKNKDARQNGVGARSDEQQGQRNNSYSQRNSNAASAKFANNQQSNFDSFGQQIPFDEVIPF